MAQNCLEECGIVVDMIHLTYEKRPAVADGIRLGTPIVTKNGMGPKEMDGKSALVDTVLRESEVISDREYKIGELFREKTRTKVRDLCSRFGMR
ncbi:MAG: hypothetical protein ACYTDW_04050 [Planctomycetota bacterium]|jgi:glycine/serine hydroxymethyltransferase